MKHKRLWKLILIVIVYAIVIVIAVKWRAGLMAKMLGGHYSSSDLIFDCVALGLIIAVVHLFSYGIKYVLRKAIGRKTFLQKASVFVIHSFILIIIGGSFILTLFSLHPQRIIGNRTPKTLKMEYTDVQFVSKGINLSAWFIPSSQNSILHGGKNAPIILVAHGLGANKDNFLSPALLMHSISYDVSIFDFRAHGASNGKLITYGLNEADDINAVCEWINKQYPDRPIYGLGYSLGGAAVIRAQAKYGVFSKIVVDSTFASLEGMAKQKILNNFSFLSGTFWQLCRFWAWFWTAADLQDNNPEKDIANITVPILIIHGTNDHMIPYTESQKLSKANPDAQLWLIEGKDHIQGIVLPEYLNRLEDFFGGID